jgi:hypothetical protein
MLAARGQYEHAEQEYHQILAAQSLVLGPDHPYTLATRHESPECSRCEARRN